MPVDGIVQFEGSLRTDPADAISEINQKLGAWQLRAILTEAERNQVRVTLLPTAGDEPAQKESNWWLHGILLVLTLATTMWVGALQQGVNILQHPTNFTVGLPYSIGLLLIFGAHELGTNEASQNLAFVVLPKSDSRNGFCSAE